ncbi:hypothetical protein [Nocardioides piscis]|uniref:PQQ-binding-like beta-propeller repeat protein n=1 Tax=Nocardioides piscis TaxID=2714938 RepID=A0A6G7YEG9_9ACTN|nr:hypothetical protein [Nocardioides piscis]QIK75076.1 hypothetical protein G7071_06185 [Nocardioides piscis]
MIWIFLGVLLAWVALGPWVLVAVFAALCVPRLRWWVQDRLWITWRRAGVGVAVLAVILGLVVLVPDGWLPIPQSPGLLVTPSYVGRPASEPPVQVSAIPQNPHLARNGASSMHNDAAASDAYPWAGPLGLEPEVDTSWFGIEECATLAFDSRDRLIALCGDLKGPTMHVLDPETMRKLATKDLPDRAKSEKKPWEDLCGGAYFYLDAADRAVVATTDRRILAISTADADGDPDLTTDQTWDLAKAIPEDDCLIALLPDWSGHIWFETQDGLVGTVDPASGKVRTLELGEEISNSFATDETGGTYVVTTHALHRLTVGPGGAPVVDWRSEYDRGSEKKKGQLSQGSGTTPTIIDGGIVAITDNAEPRMNVAFYERSSGREICRAPVFDDDASATDNSLISVGDGVIVENNHGYGSPLTTVLGRGTSPGLARVDVAGGECRVAWTSDEVAPSSVAKVSLATGLAYAYTKKPNWWGVSAWYLTAIDVDSGRTAFSVRTGTGVLMNNHYAAMTIAPDGAAWIATLAGLVRVRDRAPSDAVARTTSGPG